ncbi:hypothetical protein L0U85_17135 [Glycomyces sp. L485]|uniref:hypothetical protein n=1 Tax=Glycomyces sp. L485 TaxID=2909235 RepID=UPI001F4A1447|nr:hypothetical protein [Glycomyces sp. L485]MCH7232564.1 hypothetical protein [Glycomyces sp. L485]
MGSSIANPFGLGGHRGDRDGFQRRSVSQRSMSEGREFFGEPGEELVQVARPVMRTCGQANGKREPEEPVPSFEETGSQLDFLCSGRRI